MELSLHMIECVLPAINDAYASVYLITSIRAVPGVELSTVRAGYSLSFSSIELCGAERMEIEVESSDVETGSGSDLSFLRCHMQMIDRLSTALIVMGSISVICGVPTIIMVMTIPSIPFITGSGVWTGALVITIGVLGLFLIKEAEKDVTPRLKRLAISIQVMSIIATHAAFMHLAFSVWGSIGCWTNPDPGEGSAAQCKHHTSGLTLQGVYGTIIGTCMSIGCAITSVYISGTLKAIKTYQENLTDLIV